MRIIYNRLVQSDVDAIIDYLERKAGSHFAEKFFDELSNLMESAKDNPLQFHPVGDGLRRANLRRFEYHFLYRVKTDHIRILVVKHDRRRSTLGRHRK